MNRYLHYILLLPWVLASCVYDDATDDIAAANSDRQVQVTFTLAAGNARTVTRAEGPTWGDDYLPKPGTERENAIAPGDLSVWLYTADESNQPVAQVENLAYFRNDDGQSYTYHGTLTADDKRLTPNTPYKLMVMANCGKPSFGTDPTNLTFSQNSPYIPMWGIKTLSNGLKLEAGVNQDVGEIGLLRAMAKIEITLADTIRDRYDLNHATLNRYNEKGHCLPSGWSTVKETAELNREEDTPPSFFPSYSPAENVSFEETDDEGTLVCYVPEYEHEPGNPAILTIDINGKEYTLELKDHKTDQYYNLVRNHIYHYDITDVNDGVLTINYQVLPWEGPMGSEIEYSTQTGWQLVAYGVDVSTAELNDLSLGDQFARFGMVTYPTYADTHNPTTLKDESAIATFTFHYPKPVGTVWTAHLSNTEDFEFVDEDGYATTGIDRNESYKIGIRAKKPWTNGTSFDDLTENGRTWEANHTVPSTYLYITISYDGKHQEELVINGIHTGDDDGNDGSQVTNAIYKEKRRFPGSNTRIWIRQLPAKQGMTLWQLAEDVVPGDPDYQWWRVNPYWDHEAAAETQH